MRRTLPALLLVISGTMVSTSHAGPAFDPVCDSTRPLLAVGLDTTTKRSPEELGDARALLDFLGTDYPEGHFVAVYHDAGDGTPKRVAGPICKPTRCVDTHPILALFRDGFRRCSRAGYQRALDTYREALAAGFKPYFAESDAPESRIFSALASIKRDTENTGWSRVRLVYLSDGKANNQDIAPYRPGADWLTPGSAQDALFDILAARGALPRLSLMEILFVGFGRAHASDARLASTWDSPAANSEMKDFWSTYSGETGAAISFQPSLTTTALTKGM